MRWGAVTSADPNRYQVPFWSGVAIRAHQLEPLRRVLASPRANLPLADDVGLGKTIEAGLVLQELFLRHRARTAVIPPMNLAACAALSTRPGLWDSMTVAHWAVVFRGGDVPSIDGILDAMSIGPVRSAAVEAARDFLVPSR